MDNNFTRALSRILSYSYLILTPLKLIFLKAIPTLVLYLYTILRYGVYYLVLFLRTALVPVLYPLRLFIWRPTMAVLMVVYQVSSAHTQLVTLILHAHISPSVMLAPLPHLLCVIRSHPRLPLRARFILDHFDSRGQWWP